MKILFKRIRFLYYAIFDISYFQGNIDNCIGYIPKNFNKGK